MRGVLSPSGTRLAPTEAARRPVACCFERPEQLLILPVYAIPSDYTSLFPTSGRFFVTLFVFLSAVI